MLIPCREGQGKIRDVMQNSTKENASGQTPREDLLHLSLRQARRLVIAVLGGTIVLLGVIMLVTPGPAMVVIPLGLAVLATEFIWARHLLKRIKYEAEEAWSYLKNTPEKKDK